VAITELYVDPSIAADSGAGTVGDPYGDLEYCIEQETFDLTNGTRVNIKAGTDEVLAADLVTACQDTSVSVAWAPTEAAPLVFRGYTSAAGDGGIGGISGGGSVPVFGTSSSTYRNMSFVDLHLHNCGTGYILDLDNNCYVERCELDNTTGGAIRVAVACAVKGCYVHNIGAIAIDAPNAQVTYCYIADGTNTCTTAIASAEVVDRNIIHLTGNGDGISSADGRTLTNNSIYCEGGTGSGINQASNSISNTLSNNLIQGFSGAGGIGVEFGTASGAKFYGGNAVYDCTTAYDTATHVQTGAQGDNETLSSSPFQDPANGDFRPVNTGNVREGALPQDIAGQ